MFYLVLPFCFIYIRSLTVAVFATTLTLFIRYHLGAWVFSLLSNFPDNQRYLPYTFAWEFWLPSQLPVFMLGLLLFFSTKNCATCTARGFLPCRRCNVGHRLSIPAC